jgi:hypothetical protein
MCDEWHACGYHRALCKKFCEKLCDWKPCDSISFYKTYAPFLSTESVEMKVSRLIAFLLIGIAILMTAAGGITDMTGLGQHPTRCSCGCPMCAAGRCAATLYGGQCPCNQEKGLYVSKHHLWNDGLFLILLAIVLLVAF